MACVALASKIEEAPRKIRDVINVFNHIRQVKNGKTIQPVILDSNYIAQKNQVIKAERRLLKELGFCCHVKHPHKIIIMYLRLLEAQENKPLAQSSWNYMNDALRTDVFVRHTPETIACACIWLAGRKLRIPLPESPPWYYIFKISTQDIEAVAASILKLYVRKKVKLETLETRVEEIRREQQEARLRNKVVIKSTPVTTNNFSPSSHNNTPNKSGQSPSRGKRSSSDRSHSRSRSRSHSRDRHRSKKYSRTPSPSITPPPRFIKSKDGKGVVRSRSRSHSRSPVRNYDKYKLYDKYDPKAERYSKQERYSKNDRYEKDEKSSKDRYINDENYPKNSSKYDSKEKNKYSGSKFDVYSEKKKYEDKYDSSKKYYDNGFDKPHKAKKNGRHRSRSRDRRR